MKRSSLVLQYHFDWWDMFISRWLDRGEDECRLGVCEYLPEPWYGWSYDSPKDLHSVVLNLNPADGSDVEQHDLARIWLKGKSYREAIRDGSFAEMMPQTGEWHRVHRAKPIAEALNAVGGQKVVYHKDILENHLSIEFCPYHFVNASLVEPYVKRHSEDFVLHSLAFAAEASRVIKNRYLSKKVIVRCKETRFCGILDTLKGVTYTKIHGPNNVSGVQLDYKTDCPSHIYKRKRNIFKGVTVLSRKKLTKKVNQNGNRNDNLS